MIAAIESSLVVDGAEADGAPFEVGLQAGTSDFVLHVAI
jgi:hypothetical protein